jgi:hypothetical protein
MRYLMFICRDTAIEFSAEDRVTIGPDVEAWATEMEARGVRLEGHVLAPVDDAVNIRMRSGETTVGHGPLAGANEPIAGFNVLDCADLDEATEVASRHPMTRFGTVQLRAFADG